MNYGLSMSVRIDDAGYEFIKRWEGVRNKAYRDSAGIPTIGIGFIRYKVGARAQERAGTRVQMQDYLTDDEIKAEFTVQIAAYEDAVAEAVKVALTQSQVNALVSLCYNIGANAFKGSTVVRLLNQRKYQAACTAIGMWNKAGGRVVQGLVNRRKAEQVLFFRDG